jgi:hypothetical protein
MGWTAKVLLYDLIFRKMKKVFLFTALLVVVNAFAGLRRKKVRR